MTIRVEIFTSPGCTHCVQAKNELEHLVETVGDDRLQLRTVEVLDEIDYAVVLGVLSTPAIAIDGELVFTSLPSTRKLRQVLKERLAGSSDASAPW